MASASVGFWIAEPKLRNWDLVFYSCGVSNLTRFVLPQSGSKFECPATLLALDWCSILGIENWIYVWTTVRRMTRNTLPVQLDRYDLSNPEVELLGIWTSPTFWKLSPNPQINWGLEDQYLQPYCTWFFWCFPPNLDRKKKIMNISAFRQGKDKQSLINNHQSDLFLRHSPLTTLWEMRTPKLHCSSRDRSAMCLEFLIGPASSPKSDFSLAHKRHGIFLNSNFETSKSRPQLY